MQRCVHEFTNGHHRSWDRTVSLGTSRGSQPCPQVDFRPPELRGRKTRPQETSEKAGSCEGRGHWVPSMWNPSNITWHPAQPQSRAPPPSQPASHALLHSQDIWEPGTYPLLEGTKDPSAAHGPDTRQSKCLRSPVRHQAPCWAPSVSLKPNRKELGERARPASPHGSSVARAACMGLSHRGHPLHPWGTAPRAISPSSHSYGRQGPGRWHLLSEEVFVFPLADSKQAP